MEIIRTKNSGFCFGVKRAVASAENLIKAKEKGEVKGGIFTCGQVVHNKDVTEDLERRGLRSIEDIDQAKAGDTVLIRAHGMPESFYHRAEEKNVNLIDATCTFVAKIHKYVKKAHEEGQQVVIVGDRNHPEIIGINGWCKDSAIIINSEKEAEAVKAENLFVVAQTTIRKEHFENLVEILRSKNVSLKIMNTICAATDERQISTKETAKQVDAMVVIGGKNSSNSKKLFEIAEKKLQKMLLYRKY